MYVIMAHLRNTLESAGYLYNPFTQGDTWGQPTQFMNKETHAQELVVGADDSALDTMAQPGLQHPSVVTGSSNNADFRKVTPKQIEQVQAQTMLFIFVAVLAVAFYAQR